MRFGYPMHADRQDIYVKTFGNSRFDFQFLTSNVSWKYCNVKIDMRQEFKYVVRYCTNGYQTPLNVSLPNEAEKVWYIAKQQHSIRMHCNDKEIINFNFESQNKTLFPKCVPLTGNASFLSVVFLSDPVEFKLDPNDGKYNKLKKILILKASRKFSSASNLSFSAYKLITKCYHKPQTPVIDRNNSVKPQYLAQIPT